MDTSLSPASDWSSTFEDDEFSSDSSSESSEKEKEKRLLLETVDSGVRVISTLKEGGEKVSISY